MRRKLYSVIATLLAVIVLASGCSAEAGATADVSNIASSKDTLIIALPNDPGTVDRHLSASYNYVSTFVIDNLLTQVYNDDGSISAVCDDESLATSYQVDDDGKGITFKLREGVLFSDGTPLAASDVVFSIRLNSDLSQYAMVDFDNIKAADDTTVYVPLKYADANAVYNVGKMVPIYSEKHSQKVNDPAEFYSTSALSTAPYRIVEWVSGDYLRCEANDYYYAGAPKIRNLILRFMTDASVAFMELENGGVDILMNPNWVDTESVINGQMDGIDYWKNPSALTLQLGFNCSGALSDLKLRQCVATAIDKMAVAQGAFQGSGTVSFSVVPLVFPGTVDYTDSWPYAYDVEKAKALLKEAGYEPGQLTLKAIVGAGDKQRTSAAEIIGSYLEAVGIRLEIKSVDIATYAATIENSPKEWDLWLRNFGSSMGAAPSAHDFFATTLFKVCHLDSQENAAKMKELAQQMGQAVDENARLTTYKELQDFYLNDCLYTYPLVESIFYTLVNSQLKNAGRVGQDEWMITNAYFE